MSELRVPTTEDLIIRINMLENDNQRLALRNNMLEQQIAELQTRLKFSDMSFYNAYKEVQALRKQLIKTTD